MRITGLDHLVITVRDVDATCAFYRDVLAMRLIPRRIGLRPARLTCVCLWRIRWMMWLPRHERHVDCLGPVNQTGAHGAITSVYVRDPDRNLIELSRYDQD